MTEPSPADQADVKYETWQDLRDDVDARDGVLTVNMIALREIAGKSRLKSQVVAGIADKLKDIGLGHLPAELPRNQNGWVVLFRKSGPAGELLDAVRGGNLLTTPAIKGLRQLNTSDAIKTDKAKDAKLAEVKTELAELQKKVADLGQSLQDLAEVLEQ